MTQPPAAPPAKRNPIGIIALAVIVLAALCVGGIALFGGGDKEPAAATSSPAARTSSNPAAAAPAAGCLPVSATVVGLFDDQAQTGTGMKMTGRASAVKSPDFAKVYFVAAEFSATGVDNQVGVWAVNNINATPNAVFSVDGFSKQFTDWPDGAKSASKISGADPSAAAAKRCLQQS